MDTFACFFALGLVVFGSLYCLRNMWAIYRSRPAGPKGTGGRSARPLFARRIAVALEILLTTTFLLAATCFAIDAIERSRPYWKGRESSSASQEAGRLWTAPSGARAVVFTDVVLPNQERTGFDFTGKPLTDADLTALIAETPHATSLLIGDTKLTAEGLAQLRICNQLTCLSVMGLPVTEEFLKSLACFDRLATLDLTRTRVSEQGLKSLGCVTSLRRLKLQRTNIGDQHLQALEGMRHLRQIDLQETPVTPAAIARLRESLPECNVVCKR